MDIRPHHDIQTRAGPLFRVYCDRRTRGLLTIEWKITTLVEVDPDAAQAYGALSTFLYWAQAYDATYGVFNAALQSTLRGRPAWELECRTGGYGTRLRDVIIDWTGVYRLFPSTHTLTRHGLDGLPARFVANLQRSRRPRPLIRVELPDGGVFCMSLEAWTGYARSGRTSDDLADLGITVGSVEEDTAMQGRLWG